MRRIGVSLIAAFVLLVTALLPVAAQQATPSGDFAGLGLPELDVTVTATGYEGIPSTLAAGRYLVNLTATADVPGEDGGLLAFMQPVGMTIDDVLTVLGGAPATADAMPTGSPVADHADHEDQGPMGPPPEYFDFKLAGGVTAPAGGTARIVLDLTPGDWIAWADQPGAAQQPVVFTVTGEMPANLVEPVSSATITMGEYTIEVTAGEVKAGPQILRIDNIGAQPHFFFTGKIPDGVTNEQIGQVLESQMTGTPVDVGFDPNTELLPVFGTGTQSTGTSTWISVDLEPGTYTLICFFPDVSDGIPHAMKGMHAVIVVSE